MTLPEELAFRFAGALLHSVWQVAGLAVILAALLYFLPGARARVRSVLASLTLLASVVLFLATAARIDPSPLRSGSPAAKQALALPHPRAGHPAGRAFPPHATRIEEPFDTAAADSTTPPLRTSVWVTGLWLFGVAALSIRHAVGLRRVSRLRRSSLAPADATLDSAVRRAFDAFATARRIPVLVTDRLASPALVGLIKPVILIPAAAVSRLPPAQLELLVAHEVAHLKHLDPLLNHLTLAAETVLFYHPAAWWIARVARREREFACDDAVLDHFGNRYSYARALTSLQELPPPPGLALASSGQATSFVARIHRILGLAPAPRPQATWTPAFVLAAASALALAVAAAQDAEPAAQTDRAPGTRGAILDRGGIVIATSSSPGQRTYPLGANLAHVVGYATAEDAVLKGRTGVESAVDRFLVDGDDIYLTIDASIQTATETAMRDVGRGAAVVLDPRNGDVLALVSVPSFDPSEFAAGIAPGAFARLRDNPARPLANRALTTYPPASTFKLVTALAAARTGHAGDTFTCSGTTPIDGRHFRCWERSGHGTLGIGQAITASCNCYFYQLATRVGAPAIHAAAADLGFGAATGIALPAEASGHLFDPGTSTPTTLANHTVGQGEILATPLQIAVATAAIANGGTRQSPRLIDRVTRFETAVTSKVAPESPSSNPVSADDLTMIRNAMRDVVNSDNGTGRRARSDHLTIAGKSGTAQILREHDGARATEHAAWFTAFAPFDEPELVVTIVVEHGVSGGTTSAPLAKRILEQSLIGDLPTPSHLPPYPGHLEKAGAP